MDVEQPPRATLTVFQRSLAQRTSVSCRGDARPLSLLRSGRVAPPGRSYGRLTQRLECHPHTVEVAGSNPAPPITRDRHGIYRVGAFSLVRVRRPFGPGKKG